MVSGVGGAKSLAIWAIAYAGTAALQKGVGFVLFLWLAHSLSVEAYAKFGLLYGLQTGIAALAVAGIIESVVGLLKEYKADAAKQRLFDSANTIFAMLSAGSIAVLILVYDKLVHDVNASKTELLFVTVAGVFTAFFALQAQLVRLEENHTASLALSFFPPLVGLVAGFLSFLTGQTVSSFFGGTAVGLVVALVPFAVGRIGSYRFTLQMRETTPILSRISPFILIVALGWLGGYGNTYVVQSFFTPTEVARFTFAYTLSSIMQLVASSLNQVWSPRFFRIVHEMPVAEVESRNRRFSAMQGVILGVAGAIVLAVVPFATKLVGPSLASYRDLELELFFLFAAYAVSIPWWHAQNYYFAHSKGAELMNVTLATSAIGMAGWVCAMWLLGVIGIYVGFMLLMLTRMVGALLWARKKWSINILWEGPVVALLLLGAGSLTAKPFANLQLWLPEH